MKYKQIFSILLLLTITLNAFSQKFEGLAPTPPMGWNSWNYFSCDGINEQVIREIADAMVNSGMKDAGYEYVVIDDCWQVDREEDGTIIADPEKFPSGMKALADYVHSKGLKFGIYSDAGTMTCQKRPGSRGYEFQDARTYAEWGVDYLKYDWCHTGEQSAKESYKLMRDAIYKAGRPMVFSLCEWGLSKPWTWAKDVGHLWRTCGDIRNNWDTPDANNGKIWGGGVIINLDLQQDLEKFAGPDHWNDPDMLEVGNGALTYEESKSHFSLWAMLAAPLMAGNDLRNMSDTTLSILTNKEIIAIDQDPLGIAAEKVIDKGEFEVFLKPLQNNEYAVCLFNREDFGVEVSFDWNDLKLEHEYELKEVWEDKSYGTTKSVYQSHIPRHGIKHFKLTKMN
ncbi:MAG: glycoside hydrolase family 27 protein [Prolixibacteraceae bacterium]